MLQRVAPRGQSASFNARRHAPLAGSRYAADMQPRAKFWVEKNGKLVLSDYRVRLLELIEQTGSLADAAEEMHLSYRRAWGKVREIEQNLGVKLVESAAGGPGGGGSSLTSDGRRLVELYERFRRSIDANLVREFERTFGSKPRV